MDYKKRGLYRFMLVQRFKTYNIYYDNKTSVSSAADGQEFDKAATPLNNGASLVKNTLSITTPTAFSYLTLEIKSDGTSNAGFEINDITFLYRILRAH